MKIAITGTIGSGKSVVSNYLRSKELKVFDCDEYNKFLLENDNDVLDKVLHFFPDAVEHLKINRKKLANIIFRDDEKRLQLESIMHPLILKKMKEEAESEELFFAEVPLLFEKNLDDYFDVIILVVCNEKIGEYRLAERGFSKKDIDLRKKNQLPTDEKIKRATEIIYNNGSFQYLYEEIDKLLLKYGWE